MADLAGKVAIITDITPGNAEETAAAVRKAGGRAEVLAQDVTKWDSCRDVAAKVLAAHGQIDILVTNAGVSKSVPITELDEAEWDRVHNVNINAVCPGVVRTPLWDPLLQQLSANKGITEAEVWGEFVSGIPLARPQEPEDIGEAVAFLASDRACNITAKSANLSGGQFNW